MCSNKKRTGIILVIFGIVAVVVGILVGQFITRRVKQGLDDQICINSKDHTGYDSWIGASESSASIYFWHIKNKNGFLHKGETPQFEERGPYVYKTTTEKIDVSFDDNGHVTYKKYSQQTFDADATAQACPQCKESDQMTVLNLGYLGAVAQAGGDMGIALAMVPPIVGGYILQLNATLGSGTYHYLGRVEPTNTTLTLDFGHWLSSQSQFASLNTSYNSTEMMGLYNALTNSSLLLPTTGVPCKDNPIPSGCGLVTYVPAYMKILKAIATAAGSNVSSLQAQAAGLKLLIDKITCPVENMICFKANDTLTMTALLTFITSHLPMFVMAYFDNNNIGLLTTRPQKELTLGYVMDKLPMPPLYPNGTPVPGFLTHHTSKEQARLLSKSETFHTCKSSGGNRFTWAGYDGKTSIPSEYHRNLKASERPISGYDQTFKTADLKPCSSNYAPSEQSYNVFLAPLYTRATVTYKGPVQSQGIHLNRYTLSSDNMKANNISRPLDGVFDMSSFSGLPMSTSLPGFLTAEPILYQQMNLSKPTDERYLNFLDVEPVSGRVLNAKLRFQVNAIIPGNAINVTRIQPLNISARDDDQPYRKYVPIMWTESGGEIGKSDAEALKKQLFGALDTSCTLSILIPCVGGVLFCAGVVMIIIAYKKSQTQVTDIA